MTSVSILHGKQGERSQKPLGWRRSAIVEGVKDGVKEEVEKKLAK